VRKIDRSQWSRHPYPLIRHALPALPPQTFSDKTTPMSNLNDELLRAVEIALSGDWDTAHQFVQQHEENATASWIHAVLHKMEGDLSNSRYWYRRAGRLDHVDDEPRAELEAIQKELGAH
jgi:hypothetical protein